VLLAVAGGALFAVAAPTRLAGSLDRWAEWLEQRKAGGADTDFPSVRIALYNVALWEARRDGDGKQEAELHLRLGDAYGQLSGSRAWTKAVDHYGDALAAASEAGDRDRQANALLSRGTLYRGADYQLALRDFQRMLAIVRADGRKAQVARALQEIGSVQMNLGQFEQARVSLEEALQVAGMAKNPIVLAAAPYYLGRLHRIQGEFDRAIERFQQALVASQDPAAQGSPGNTLLAMGTTYFYSGDSDLALAKYQAALAVGREARKPEITATALASIGRVLQSQGRIEQALESYRRASETYGTGGKDSDRALVLYYIGMAQVAWGRPGAALGPLEQALALYRRTGQQPRQAQALLEIATAYRDRGDLTAAETRFGQVRALAEGLQGADLKSLCLYRWAGLDRRRGDLPAAAGRLREALALIEDARRRVSSQELRTTFFASKRQYYDLYIELLMELDAREPGRRYAESAFEASESARSRVLLELIASGPSQILSHVSPELRRRVGEIRALIQGLTSLLEGAADPVQIHDLSEKRLALERQEDELTGEILGQDPRYAQIRTPKVLGSEEIRGLLDDDTALLEYHLGDERSFLFVLTRESLHSCRLPSAQSLASSVRRLRSSISEPGPLRRQLYADQASQLYREILGCAGPILQAKHHLIVVPEGPLASLPFEALLTARPDSTQPIQRYPFLLLSHSVSYVPSASVLAALQTKRTSVRSAGTAARPFLAYAAPLYGSVSGPRAVRSAGAPAATALPALPYSAGEVEEIARELPRRSRLYLGAEASEENVKQNPLLGNAGMVHFAVHGTLDEEHPERSGLELAQSPLSQEDGVLRVPEIFGLQMDAELVTLSACETGRGKDIRGEGILGLTRAFLYAGAHSLAVSLWSVSDRSTRDLMVDFYRRLGSVGKVEALRQSKLRMIRESPRRAHPYHWASFILVGDP
jgi:CHAT domain-containing protein/tetratricopeptide (TPR) repeat protein